MDRKLISVPYQLTLELTSNLVYNLFIVKTHLKIATLHSLWIIEYLYDVTNIYTRGPTTRTAPFNHLMLSHILQKLRLQQFLNAGVHRNIHTEYSVKSLTQ